MSLTTTSPTKMLLSSCLWQTAKLSMTSKTKIVFNENMEFAVVVSKKDSFNYNLHIEDVKGSFTNLRIGSRNTLNCLFFDRTTHTYQTNLNQLRESYNFLIDCEIEYTTVTALKWTVDLKYESDYLKFLNVFECYDDKFPIADYEFYKLQYYVKKVNENFVEVTVKNPHKLQINGQKNDYSSLANVSTDLNLNLSIIYDPIIMEMLDKNARNRIHEAENPLSNASIKPVTDRSKEFVSVLKEVMLTNDSSFADTSVEIVENDSAGDNAGSENVLAAENHIPTDSSPQNPEMQAAEETVTSDDELNETIFPPFITFESKATQKYRKMSTEEFMADVLGIPVDDLLSRRNALIEECHIPEDATPQNLETQTVEETDIINEELNETSNLFDKLSFDENAEISEDHIPVDLSPQNSEKQTLEKTVTVNKISSETSKPTLDPSAIQINDYVLLISSDGKRIYSSASLLTRHSYVFSTILKKIKKSPVKINLEEFDAETIYAALDFLNGKTDVIKGKEIQLYHFAEKYSLRDLKNACCSKFDKILCLQNVCEIIEIAYANYFEELKLKCIKMIGEKRKEIDLAKFNKLPEEIREELSETHSLEF